VDAVLLNGEAESSTEIIVMLLQNCRCVRTRNVPRYKVVRLRSGASGLLGHVEQDDSFKRHLGRLKQACVGQKGSMFDNEQMWV